MSSSSSGRPLSSSDVADLRLPSRINSTDADYVRNHLSKNAEPSSQRYCFADESEFHSVAAIFNQAVKSKITLASVANAIEFGARDKALADKLRARDPT